MIEPLEVERPEVELLPVELVQGHLAALLDWAEQPAREPLSLTLGDTSELLCTDILRWLPGRRLVCAAVFAGAPVVVKWFIGKGAQRYHARELRGVQRLLAARLPTPKIVAAWRVPGVATGEAFALVFERLVDALPLNDELLQESTTVSDGLWQLLADLHSAGLTHTDLHFGNVLYWRDELWLIDGDAVQAGREPGAAETVWQFAWLAAQFRQSLSFGELRDHWHTYLAARRWDTQEVSLTLVERRYRHARRQRILQFQAKTQRTCSGFALRRSILGQALLDRQWLGNLGDASLPPESEATVGRELLSWLDSLPELISGAGSDNVLKRGNTATVAAVSFRDQQLVVKRYNNKSIWHRLRRWLRPDRGLTSWVYGHTLDFVGIPGARAVALLRTPLAGPTYLVMRSLPGEPLQPELLAQASAGEQLESVGQQLVALLQALASEGLVHNDTKASNFVWEEATGQMALIDLDAMEMPKSRRAARNGHERDRRRLLRNFAATPELQRRFRSLLGL